MYARVHGDIPYLSEIFKNRLSNMMVSKVVYEAAKEQWLQDIVTQKIHLMSGGTNVRRLMMEDASPEFKKENFPNNPQEFADVLKKLELGTEYFNQGKKEMDDFRGRYILTNKYFPVSVHDYQKAGYKNFRLAYSLLNDADKFNPKNANVNYMLGLISFMTEPKSPESFYFLRTALSQIGRAHV